MVAPNLKMRSHSCECMCVTCERNGAGYFAQRDLLAGHSTAAQHLSPSLVTWLTAQRAERLTAKQREAVK